MASLAIVILMQFVGLVIAYYGFVDVSKQVSFIDSRLYEKLAGEGRDDATDNFDVTQFMKDLYVNVGLYGDCIAIFLLIAVAGMSVYIFCLLKSRAGKQC